MAFFLVRLEAGTINSLGCQAILFDLDGVLVDSRACIETIWRSWAPRHGLDPDAILRVAHGRRTSETLREIAPHLDIRAETAVLDRMEAEERRGVEPVPGAAQILALLTPPQWAIVTSGGPEVARFRLAVGGLPIPAVFISAHDVLQGKPDPEGYLRAAKALGVLPSDCVVLEDAPAGVAAGKGAGMAVIAVLSTHEATPLAAADYFLPRLADLQVRPSGPTGLNLFWMSNRGHG